MGAFDRFRRDIPAFSFSATTVNSDGTTTVGSENSFTIKASCQPSRAEDVQLLPENRRNNGGTFRIYTNDTLRTINETTDPNSNPDQIELFGERYEIFQSETWGNNLINHNKYLAVKVVTK